MSLEKTDHEDESAKEKLEECIDASTVSMSSDESNLEEDGTKSIITYKFPWLSDVVEDFNTRIKDHRP